MSCGTRFHKRPWHVSESHEGSLRSPHLDHYNSAGSMQKPNGCRIIPNKNSNSEVIKLVPCSRWEEMRQLPHPTGWLDRSSDLLPITQQSRCQRWSATIFLLPKLQIELLTIFTKQVSSFEGPDLEASPP
jgi:hypothetical protein